MEDKVLSKFLQSRHDGKHNFCMNPHPPTKKKKKEEKKACVLSFLSVSFD
jgi:hypothetical protein